MPIRPDNDTSHIDNLINWIMFGKDADKYTSPVKKLQKPRTQDVLSLTDVWKAKN